MRGASVEAHQVEQLVGAVGVASRRSPAMSAGSSTFSAAVSVGSRLKNWKTKPNSSRRSRVSSRSSRSS